MPLRGGRSAAFLLLIHLLGPTVVFTFNLDTSHVIRKSGEPGSLFGFSLALHRQVKPDKVMLLTGAPRARALGNQMSTITGGLYKCEINQANDCERVEFDNDENPKVEYKENQWLGVTVQSQGPGGKILTCAHRYQMRMFVNTPQESHDIIGRCYVLSQNLTIDSSSDEDGGNWKLCEGRTRGHERFGVCQQGLAATFTKDYHYVVFGAPGGYNWRGIVRVEQKNNTFLEMGVFDDGPYEIPEEDLLKTNLPANSYLGFSLDSGHSIMKHRGLTVVAGAPRANHSGAVILLKKETSDRLIMEHTLHGPGLASSFGYDVTVVDLNNDGWQDIVVGAPQFYMKDRDIGGAVYIYINKAGKWEKVTPVRLNGTKHSMFGLAVQNTGDINQDSYEDIAVGAPHDDGGSGKIYIYHGSARGIKTIPAQIISGKEHNIQLFGYSLAGNMDVDGNSYPDLAVGSLSDTAFIYRARPVISIRRKVTVYPWKIDLRNKTCGNGICFSVKACFAYKANPSSYNPQLTIGYLVEADGTRRKQGLTSRAAFLNKSHAELDHQANGTFDLHGQNQEKCINLTARVKDNIKDKMHSIPIELSAEIVHTKRQKTKNGLPQITPILDASQPNKDFTEVNFVKEGCRKDGVCRSNLKMDCRLCYKQNNQEEVSPLNSKDNVYEFLLSYEKKDLALEVAVTNMNGDDAYEAKVVADFPASLSYSGVRSQGGAPIICIANQNGSHVDCELGNPFKRESKIIFFIILSTSAMSLDTTEIVIDLQLQTTSAQENITPLKIKSKVIIELPLSVTGEASPSQVSFGGVVKGESAMKTEEEVGSLINYTFRINNLWKTSVSSFKPFLQIEWPKSNKDGKWLLYLVKVTSKGPEDVFCSPASEINSLNLTQGSSVSRTKRETVGKERTTEGKIHFFSSKHKVLSCSKEINCVVLHCPLKGLDGTAVELRSRLWNSTFIEEYASVQTLSLVVKASLVLQSQAHKMTLKNPEAPVTVSISPDSSVAQYGVPWWIILLAILAGILILALMIFMLWKCGFFRRSKQDDSVRRYHAVRIRKETLAYKDGNIKLDPFGKKQWMTTWMDNESYS
ncbi:integrin alpha-6 [Xenentodon cancila]